MKDKLSYFDIMAYFAPGLLLLWAAQQSLRFDGLSTYFQMDNWAFESLAGLVLAFVLGQLVSARARNRFEGKAVGKWTPVFSDGLVSENFLLKARSVYGRVLCPEPRRLMLIEMATTHCHLSASDVDKLTKWEDHLDVAQELSHHVYRPLLTLLADEEIGEKASTMNVRYVFFRNLNVAAAYGALLFAVSACYNLWFGVPFVDARIILPTILAVLFALTSFVARREAVHFAINHVREVFDSALHFYSGREAASPQETN